MKNKLIGLILFSGMLTGCDYLESGNEYKEKHIEKLVTEGEVTDLGVIDGCNVKKHYKLTPKEDFSKRDKNEYYSYDNHSFYIAKCDGKPTTTTTQKVGGKIKHDEAMIAVDEK